VPVATAEPVAQPLQAVTASPEPSHPPTEAEPGRVLLATELRSVPWETNQSARASQLAVLAVSALKAVPLPRAPQASPPLSPRESQASSLKGCSES